MKNVIKKIFALVVPAVFVLAVSIAVAAQTEQKPEQITFAAGDSAKTVTGVAAAGKNRWYQVRYEANRKIIVRLTPNYKKVGLSIYDEDGSLLNEGTDGSSFEMETGVAGVIKIEVAAVKGKVPFTLTVSSRQ